MFAQLRIIPICIIRLLLYTLYVCIEIFDQDGEPSDHQIVDNFLNWKSTNVLPCILHTFGFTYVTLFFHADIYIYIYIYINKTLLFYYCLLFTRYALDSVILAEMAAQGNGTFGFIPDAGFVGTSFVNAISNLFVVCGTDVQVKINGPIKRILGFENIHNAKKEGFVLQLGSVQSGQDKHIVVELLDGSDPVTAEVSYTHMGLRRHTVSTNSHARTAVQLDDEDFQVQYFRSKFVSTFPADKLQELLRNPNTLKNSSNEFALKIEALAQEMGESSVGRNPHLIGLLQDVSGQVREAFGYEAYMKWGRHYILSLVGAHNDELCTNFKDPGIQFYGGDFWKALRDDVDKLFCTISAPIPSKQPAANRSAVARSAPVSMASYNNADDPCFAGSSQVLLANGTTTRVENGMWLVWCMCLVDGYVFIIV